METAIKVRKVTQDVLMFVWFKRGILMEVEEPSPDLRFIPEITPEFMSNLRIAICVQSTRNKVKWQGFVTKHFQRMTYSVELFAKYVSYACYDLDPDTTNVFASFFDALSLVSYFVLHCWEEGSEEFLSTSVDLFCAFFEKELLKKFEDQGGWKNLNEYLEKNFDLEKFKSEINDYVWPFECFQQPQDEEQSYATQFIQLYGVEESQVETNKRAVSFAEFVAGKMKDLRQETLRKMLAEFAKTDSLVEKLYRRTVGKASGGVAKEVEHVSSRKAQEVSETIPSKTKSEKELVKPIVTTSDTQNSDNINFSKVDVPNETLSHLFSKKEKVGKLLGVIAGHIAELEKIYTSFC